MRAKGAPAHVLEEYKNARIGHEPDDCEVWPENWKALEIFMMCRTQWRVIAGMGGVSYQGLDYTSLNSVIDRKVKPKQRERVFDDVLLIESGALPELNRKENGSKS